MKEVVDLSMVAWDSKTEEILTPIEELMPNEEKAEGENDAANDISVTDEAPMTGLTEITDETSRDLRMTTCSASTRMKLLSTYERTI